MSISRPALVVALGVPVLLALAGCAGDAAAGDGTSSAPSGRSGPADMAELATWATPRGIAPELVYVTDIEGFHLEVQTVSVSGVDDFSVGYSDFPAEPLAVVWLTMSRVAEPGLPACAELPDSTEPQAELRCTVDSGDVHVSVVGTDVGPAALREAAAGVRLPRSDELQHLFSDVPTVGPYVERGDLPEGGDQAPNNDPGPGG